jgi:hypothetical protein
MSPVGRTSRVFYAAAVLTHGVRCACSCSIAGQVHRNLTRCTFEQSKSLYIKFLAEPSGLDVLVSRLLLAPQKGQAGAP